MKCKQCAGIEQQFDQKKATKELQRYRNGGPTKVTQSLIDALIAENVSEMTLLDIGGGIGGIPHELLVAGVRSCINVEASTAYIEAAKEEAERQGHAERMEYLYGDFVTLAANIPQCDIVTLDGVICCYHDVEGLVEKSAGLARRFYCLIYPLNNWRAKFSGKLFNLSYRLRRSSFHFFVHPTKVVEEIVHKMGFERRFYEEKGMWQIVVYGRSI
jgi:magnesium-protoporphyrin O-methyltransferase